MYEAELKIAKQAARQAGKFLKPEFLNWSGKIQYKNAEETFTRCDKQSEQIIIRLLKKHFPSYTILSEEKGLIEKHSDYFWTVDPIDGTNNFIRHNPNFTVSISLLYKNEVVLGLTYVPMLDEMYWAVKNQGAYKNNKKIRISKIIYIGDIIISYNFMNKPKSQKFKIFKEKVIKTFIHGFLHLLGFDHIKNKDYKKMLSEEEKIYKSVISKIN